MEAVSLSFGGTQALDGVDFDLLPGEIHAIAGENGAGKSSLMKILAGIYQPERGKLALGDKPVRLDGVAAATAQGIAVIHQELNLVDSLSAVENVFLGKELRTRWRLPDRAAMRQRALAVLDSLGFPADPQLPVGGLRMGEKQLVEIAKALMAQASVLIMDEPTSALSPSETEALCDLCRRLRDRGMGIVLITHRLQEMFLLADRITVLRDGRLIGTWPTAEIESPAALVSLMIGRKFSAIGDKAAASLSAADAPILSIKRLSVHTPVRKVVDEVSLDVRAGEVLGLSGLLGAGKTEILEALFGVSPHRVSGRIIWRGRDVHFDEPFQAVEAGMAMVTEDRKRDGLLLDQDLEANFLLPSLARLPRYPLYDPGSARRQTLAHAAAFNVRCKHIDQTGGTLSGGNQQKLVIGKWLLHRPRLLLLDEPTRGVDTAAKAEIYGLIRSATQDGMTVVIASSEIDELMLLCDRIVVLCAGRATGKLARDAFSADALIRLAADHSKES
jgi:ribose transport system ATP-binding protein